MSVRRNNRGKWAVDIAYTHPNGRVQRVSKTSPVQTRRGAEEYERQTRTQLLAGTYEHGKEEQTQAREVPTLATFLTERWLPTYPAAAGYRQKTMEATHWALGHIRPVLGDARLADIGPEAIASLIARLRAANLSDKSVKFIVGVLRKVLVCAEEWGVLPSIPRFPKIKVPERGFTFLESDEAAALVAAAQDERDLALFVFLLDTGARVGEVVALEWGDIDWRRREVVIRRNRPAGTKVAGPTKSGKERRIPLTGRLVAALKRIRHLRPLVFSTPTGASLESKHVDRRLGAACRLAGIAKHVTPHTMRHTFASLAVASGVPLNVVQSWLGHSTIVMTMRYAHLAPDAGEQWIRALERKHGANKIEDEV